jgi:hypothetical protein
MIITTDIREKILDDSRGRESAKRCSGAAVLQQPQYGRTAQQQHVFIGYGRRVCICESKDLKISRDGKKQEN